MAYKLIWSSVAHHDLKHLVRFITLDNPARAESFGYSLIQRIERLQNFPEMGRMVPEKRDPRVRELIVRPYRVIYRVTPQQQVIEIVRIWHAARGEPEGI